ncbi:hypothetical protein SCHPADRAFT_452174 [Schizopora paradoxa]|uniref:C2H2-type domain-containing protein n=1 Tax=Schizopora paradoxa TaxID=27342 RepID=A0A0H2RQT3_9AGAM|nr:hypothetical protein SCHPADRAFT_452174 [Schizopora paradoxa]
MHCVQHESACSAYLLPRPFLLRRYPLPPRFTVIASAFLNLQRRRSNCRRRIFHVITLRTLSSLSFLHSDTPNASCCSICRQCPLRRFFRLTTGWSHECDRCGRAFIVVSRTTVLRFHRQQNDVAIPRLEATVVSGRWHHGLRDVSRSPCIEPRHLSTSIDTPLLPLRFLRTRANISRILTLEVIGVVWECVFVGRREVRMQSI